MSTKNNPQLKTIIATLLLIVSLGILATAYQSFNAENKNSNLSNIKLKGLSNLSQLNVKWVAALDKTKGHKLTDFDDIAFYTKEIRNQMKKLESLGLLDKDTSIPETVDEYQNFKNMFEIKYEAIQRYKSEKAVLRNSANFLKKSEGEVLTQLKNKKIKEDIKNTTSALSNFLLLNIAYWEEKSKAHFPKLDSEDLALESPLAKEKLTTYTKHANVILEYSPRVIDMFKTARDIDVFTLSTNISNTFLSHQAKSNKTINYWKKIILGAAITSAMAFFWLVLILFQKTRSVAIVTPKTA